MQHLRNCPSPAGTRVEKNNLAASLRAVGEYEEAPKLQTEVVEALAPLLGMPCERAKARKSVAVGHRASRPFSNPA